MKATEQYFPVVRTVYYVVHGSFICSVCIKFLSVNIQMKATEQYFPVVRTVYYVVHGSFICSVCIKFLCVNIQMKATEQHVHALAILPCSAVPFSAN